jgi:3-oxoacyl-[acyl-carrier protein] reductase
MKKFEDIFVGDKEVISHKITKEDINKFIDLTGDDNRLHNDEDFASQTQFKKPVVHGMLGASFISTVIGTKLPGDGALWFSQSLEFLIPVRVGDKLSISAEVIKKYDKDKIIELKTEIENQNRQIVTKGIAKVKLIELEVASQETEVKKIKDPVALVIGATGGIGFETCLQLAKDGFDIVIHYNSNEDKAQELKQKVEALNRNTLLVKADILNKLEIKELISKSVRKFGKIDVLVNSSATIIPNIKFQNLHWEDYKKQFEFGIKVTLELLQEVVPIMVENGYGKIINIGSLTVDKPNADWSPYITAKSALVGLTKSLAFELANKGIRINMVSPSLLSTDLTANVPEKFKLLTAAQTPLRRLADTKDVAGTIAFLASEKSNFLAGENIRLNGGQIMI